MDATARDFNQITPADTNGLDDLFLESDSVQQIPALVQDSVLDTVTVVEAAKLLGVDRRSVVRLLNWNKLSGAKDNKGKWLIKRNSVIERLGSVQDNVLAENTHVLDSAQDIVLPENVGVQDAVLDVSEHETSATVDVAELFHKLEAATYRIGYLEAQLENRDQQIKLLTDSQHRQGWWAKFASWFFRTQ